MADPTCKLCGGKGYRQEHQPGLTHYETDAGEECPDWHYKRIECPCVELARLRSSFRIGGKVPLNVYEGDRPLFQAHTPEEAKRLVALLNDTVRLRAEVAALQKKFDAQTIRLIEEQDVHKETRAEVESLRRDRSWQPIETAPKDGTNVLTWHMGGIATMAFLSKERYGRDPGGWYFLDKWRHWSWCQPTPKHWMPLPEPPKDAAMKEEDATR